MDERETLGRIEALDRRMGELERGVATRTDLSTEVRELSTRISALNEKVSPVAVLASKLDDLARVIESQAGNLSQRIEKLETADADLKKKLEELNAQRWKWAGMISAASAGVLLFLNYVHPQVSVTQSQPQAQPQIVAAPLPPPVQQSPQVIYYVAQPPGGAQPPPQLPSALPPPPH